MRRVVRPTSFHNCDNFAASLVGVLHAILRYRNLLVVMAVTEHAIHRRDVGSEEFNATQRIQQHTYMPKLSPIPTPTEKELLHPVLGSVAS